MHSTSCRQQMRAAAAGGSTAALQAKQMAAHLPCHARHQLQAAAAHLLRQRWSIENSNQLRRPRAPLYMHQCRRLLRRSGWGAVHEAAQHVQVLPERLPEADAQGIR